MLRWLPVVLSDRHWKLAVKHLVILNYELAKREWPLLSQTRVIASTYAAFLDEHAEYLTKQFDQILAEVYRKEVKRFWSHDQLARLTDADVSEVPDILATRRNGRRAAYQRTKGLVPGVAGGALGIVQRLTERS